MNFDRIFLRNHRFHCIFVQGPIKFISFLGDTVRGEPTLVCKPDMFKLVKEVWLSHTSNVLIGGNNFRPPSRPSSLLTEPYFTKHSTTRFICRSEGKFRPWNLASRRLNALLTVVTELVSYHFFTTKILSSRSRFIENDQKRTKWVTNRNYLGWSKFTFRHRNVEQTVFVFRTTIIGYIIVKIILKNLSTALQNTLQHLLPDSKRT